MYQIKFAQGISSLPNAKAIRQAVFVEEQGFHNEFDEIDGTAWHVLITEEEKPCATGRVFEEPKGSFIYHLGRIAVLSSRRGHRLGERVVRELEKKAIALGAKKLVLSAQVQAKGFYEKMGYQAKGEPYPDEHVPHVSMEKLV